MVTGNGHWGPKPPQATGKTWTFFSAFQVLSYYIHLEGWYTVTTYFFVT